MTRPILFNTEMVLAILDGRKTVTRRLVKFPKHIKQEENGLYTLYAEGTCYENQRFEQIKDYMKSPYSPGDILWVRETWSEWEGGYIYKAWNGPFAQPGAFAEGKGKWKPSIHMPKEAARIFLKVTDVRVERLQDITEEQAIAEGVYVSEDDLECLYDHVSEFAQYVWESTIKKSDMDTYGWDANPLVWVIEFEDYEKTITE